MSMASRHKPPLRQRWLTALERKVVAPLLVLYRAGHWRPLLSRRTAVPLTLLTFTLVIVVAQPPREIGEPATSSETIDLGALINQPPVVKSEQLSAPPAKISTGVDALDSALEPASESPWRESTVRNGDSLSVLLNRWGVSSRTLYLLEKSSGGKQLRKLIPGETIKAMIAEDGQLQQLIYAKDALNSEHFVFNNGGFSHRSISREPELLPTLRRGVIEDSLFLSGQRAQLPDRIIMELANIFGWDIDFIFDIREGDAFALIYEEKYLDGELLGSGNILAAKFVNRGKVYRAVRFEDEVGNAAYYSAEGVSMRKAFLRAPLDVFRISSGFNLRRKHPIHKKIKAHRGVDYAAPTGTPVFAAGDGKVIESGYSSANGNYVFIKHGHTYITKYLHLHKRSVKTGDTVKQRQVIGSVGSTGYATGPHLHYEFLVNGVHRNPRTVPLPQATPVPVENRLAFTVFAEPLLAQLEQTSANLVEIASRDAIGANGQ